MEKDGTIAEENPEKKDSGISRPMSYLSRRFLREQKEREDPVCSLGDVIIKKNGTRPSTLDDIKKWNERHKGKPCPEKAYPGIVAE